MKPDLSSERYLDKLLERIDAAADPHHGGSLLDSTALEAYEVLGELGRGGMGVVYAAREKSSGALVALKFLPGHLSMSPSSRERMRREANAIARVSHPSLVRIHAMGEKDGAPFLCMEFFPGVPLSALLAKMAGQEPASLQGPDLYRVFSQCWHERFAGIAAAAKLQIPPELAENAFWLRPYATILNQWAWQIAEALASAHGSQILHRDIKPSNILIGASGEVRLVDFGLAWEDGAESMTMSEEFVGTLYYAAPEALLSKAGQRSPASDVYSLGMVLYESLTLHNPFQAETRTQAIHRVATLEPPFVRQRNAVVPVDLETVCMTAIQKEPPWRYQGAAQFATDLRRCLQSEPVLARAPGGLTRAMRRLRRRSGAPWLGAVLVAGLAYAAYAMYQREADPVPPAKEPVAAASQPATTLSVAENPAARPEPVPPRIEPKPQLPRMPDDERRLADAAGYFVAHLFGPANQGFKDLLAARKDHLTARVLMSANYAQIRNFSEARSALLPALQARPDSKALLALHSWILLRAGQAAEAGQIERMSKRDYADTVEEAARAALFVLDGDTLAAERALARISALDSRQAWPLLARGIILAFHDRQESVRLLEEMEQRAPGDALVLTSLGFVWHSLADIEKARALFDSALEIEPGNAYAKMGMEKLPKPPRK